jgi:hypothetical protein
VVETKDKKEKKDKGKDKGEKVEVAEHWADPGAIPVTLLKLDCQAFYQDSVGAPGSPVGFDKVSLYSLLLYYNVD